MKIAILTPGGVDRSGTERVIPCLLWLIERLTATGDEVHVFAFAQERAPGCWPLLGATIHNAGGRTRGRRFVALLAKFFQEHRSGRFDVVHAFWAAPAGVAGALISRILGVPMVLTLAGGEAACCPAIGYGGRVTWRGRRYLDMAVAAADRVTVPSQLMQRDVAVLGIKADTVELGVALDRWPPRPPAQRTSETTLRLLHVANLNAVKDQPTLLAALAVLDRDKVAFELDVIGFDALGGRIHELASDLGLAERIRFHGFLPHTAMRPFFEHAHILVVSSVHESGPLVILEAAIAGVPTVGTAVGHVADFAPTAAVVVPVGDSAALAAGLHRLERDEADRLDIATAAQTRALSINADRTAAIFRKLYADVRQSSSPGAGIVPAPTKG